MNEEDAKRLVGGFSAMRDMEAELDAIDHVNDPKAPEKQAELTDLLITLSMGMGPLRKRMAGGSNQNPKMQSPADRGSESEATSQKQSANEDLSHD